MNTTDDPKLLEGIAFFEQVLASVPDDRVGLEFLTVAYARTGQEEQRRTVTLRLAKTLLAGNDPARAEALLESLPPEDAEAAALRRRAEVAQTIAELRRGAVIEAEVRNRPTAAEAAGVRTDDIRGWGRAAVASELALVRHLSRRAIVPASVCEALSETLASRPETDVPVLVSALTMLEERNPECMEAALSDIALFFEKAPIPVDLFEIPAEVAALLPEAYVRIRGVLPFGRMGRLVGVAVLNPADAALAEDVTRRVGAPCAFFLARPHGFAEAVRKCLDDATPSS